MAYRILIVDDENELQNMVKDILTQAGYETDAALSCAQAMDRFQAGNPDAVLLDINLPDGDGFSLFRQFRESRDVPILFLSARDEDADRLRGWAWERMTISRNLSCLRSCCSACARCSGGSTGRRRTLPGWGTRRSTGARVSSAGTAWKPPSPPRSLLY